jgi:copper chaperone
MREPNPSQELSMSGTAPDGTIRFQVEDMSCGHCEKTIREALQIALPGTPVHVDLASHVVSVTGPAAPAEAAIRDAGYTPVRV